MNVEPLDFSIVEAATFLSPSVGWLVPAEELYNIERWWGIVGADGSRLAALEGNTIRPEAEGQAAAQTLFDFHRRHNGMVLWGRRGDAQAPYPNSDHEPIPLAFLEGSLVALGVVIERRPALGFLPVDLYSIVETGAANAGGTCG